MVTFYPRDISLWRDYFSFDNDITLLPKAKQSYKEFRNVAEFIEFIKGFGVKLDDYKYPLAINETDVVKGGLQAYSVIQWTFIGFITDNLK